MYEGLQMTLLKQIALLESAESMIKMMTQQLRHLDIDVKKITVAHKPTKTSQLKQCYNNSYRYVSAHPGSIYVLGYIIFHGIPIEHAFVQQGNSFYDVTLNPEGNEYFKLVEVSDELLTDYVNSEQHAPDLYSLNRFVGKRK